MTITARKKMLSGALYDAADAELRALRLAARRLTHAFNHSEPDAREQRIRILDELLAAMGDGTWIEPPFHCDYGRHIELGAGIYVNFNCVILD